VRHSARLLAVAIVVSGTAVAGIKLEAPLVSGNVQSMDRQSRKETSQELSQAQLQSLSQWLKSHRSGWHGMMTEASSEKGVLGLSLRDSNGRAGSIRVVARANGGYYLQFISSPPGWSYESWGGLIKSWAGIRTLSPKDLSQLLSAIGMQELPH
jgi:hypothetical protein